MLDIRGHRLMLQNLDQLYSYMKSSREQEDEVQTAILTLPTPIQAYIRRMLDKRRSDDNPCKPPPGL
jgi:hypothetical protein